MMTRAQAAVCTAVSPMSGSPTSDTEKKETERGEFITPPRPSGRRSNNNSISLRGRRYSRAQGHRIGSLTRRDTPLILASVPTVACIHPRARVRHVLG